MGVGGAFKFDRPFESNTGSGSESGRAPAGPDDSDRSRSVRASTLATTRTTGFKFHPVINTGARIPNDRRAGLPFLRALGEGDLALPDVTAGVMCCQSCRRVGESC